MKHFILLNFKVNRKRNTQHTEEEAKNTQAFFLFLRQGPIQDRLALNSLMHVSEKKLRIKGIKFLAQSHRY